MFEFFGVASWVVWSVLMAWALYSLWVAIIDYVVETMKKRRSRRISDTESIEARPEEST